MPPGPFRRSSSLPELCPVTAVWISVVLLLAGVVLVLLVAMRS
jgi:hypothetical protein